MLLRRLRASPCLLARTVHVARTLGAWRDIESYRRMLGMLKADRSFLDFHEGRSKVLPDFYRHEFGRLVGAFAELLTEAERSPNLEQDCPVQSGERRERGARGHASARIAHFAPEAPEAAIPTHA